MATIRANQEVVTQINVFEVDPKNQNELAQLLTEAIQTVSNMPGWISARSASKNSSPVLLNSLETE